MGFLSKIGNRKKGETSALPYNEVLPEELNVEVSTTNWRNLSNNYASDWFYHQKSIEVMRQIYHYMLYYLIAITAISFICLFELVFSTQFSNIIFDDGTSLFCGIDADGIIRNLAR